MMQDFIEFIKSCPLRHFAAGDALPTQSHGTPTLLAIQAGYVKVSSIDALGNPQFLWIKGRLDVVPTERLFSLQPSDDFFYTALNDVHAYEIEKPAFLEFARNEPEVMAEIAHSMSEHYDDLLTRLHATEQATVRNKLIHTLHHISHKISAEESVKFHTLGLHLTQEDISQLIGSTRETTAIELKKLKDEKYISYSRVRFTVHTAKLATLL